MKIIINICLTKQFEELNINLAYLHKQDNLQRKPLARKCQGKEEVKASPIGLKKKIQMLILKLDRYIVKCKFYK